jgi:tRNA 2-thiouridine synthesizing protein E
MTLSLDKDGYLKDHTLWSTEVAESLAKDIRIQLKDEHWEILKLAREFYAQTDIVPESRPLTKLVRESFGKNLGNSIYLMGLFGGSYAKNVAKIAGLPRPTNCI